MKWSDIKQMCYDLLSIEDPTEDDEALYGAKFKRFANQALVVIANSVKPQIKKFTVTVTNAEEIVEMPNDFLSFTNMMGDRDGVQWKPTRFYGRKSVILNGEAKYNAVVTPVVASDYAGLYVYDTTQNKMILCTYANNTLAPSWVTVGTTTAYEQTGVEYNILYNALYDPITDEEIRDDTDVTSERLEETSQPIDPSVLAIIPHYIAFNILAQDDIQLSTVLKNDFELNLARLDTDTLYTQEDWVSTKGWF